MLWILVLSLIYPFLSINCLDFSPVVTIPDGQIIGTVNKTIGEKRTYYSYRGIPYAKPPIGSLRFKAPESNDPWSGTLYATADQESCIQMPGQTDTGTESEILGSEDCLYINVYTTSLNSSLPVIVWYYFGAFVSGTSNSALFGPDYLLEKDVIFVSLNYRVSIFGFFSTEDLAAPGNWGLKDQLLALKWVKKNIQYFGGDPEKITIAGQSAGSASITYLLQNPETEGLYRSAIMESGSSLSVWALSYNARDVAFKIGQSLGINNVNSYELIEELRKIDTKTLKIAQVNYTSSLKLDLGVPAIGVVIEPKHTGSILTTSSYKLLQKCQFIKVPVIIGFNSLEGAIDILNLKAYLQTILSSSNKSDILKIVPKTLTHSEIKKRITASIIRNHYFGLVKNATDPEADKFVTYHTFIRSISKTAHFMSHCNQAGVYFYQFSHMGNLALANRTFDGVTHAEELYYLFNIETAYLPGKRDKVPNSIDELTRQRLVTLWTNFAKVLNPTPPTASGVLKNIEWIPNTPSIFNDAAIKYLNINDTLDMKINPWEEDWLFYQLIYDVFGDRNYLTY